MLRSAFLLLSACSCSLNVLGFGKIDEMKEEFDRPRDDRIRSNEPK